MDSSVNGGFPGLDDQEWWLLYGLDGIVGALAGGLLAGVAAGLVVRATIRHERQLGRESAAHERQLVREAKALEVAGQVRAAALRVQARMAVDANVTGALLFDPIVDMQASALELYGLVSRDWPDLSTAIDKHMSVVSTAIAKDDTMTSPNLVTQRIFDDVRALDRVVNAWLSRADGV